MNHIESLIGRYPILSTCNNCIRDAYKLLQNSFEQRGKLLIAGNGGSAADSDHIVGELMKSFVKKRPSDRKFLETILSIDAESGAYLVDKLQGALPAISLCNQPSLMTASINDIDGKILFAQQVNGYGMKDDVFLGISTSGNSEDIVYAMVVAKAKGLKTIALSGRTGGEISKLADVAIVVPLEETYEIQELHLPIYHALCQQLEEHFF